MIVSCAVTFSVVLFLLFLAGCVSVCISFFRTHDKYALLRAAFMVSFILPFALYLLLGVTGREFGHARNFFYLLGFYFFIIFYGLRSLARNKKLFNYTASVLLLTLLAGSALACRIFYRHSYLEREMICQASRLKTELVIVSYSSSPWLFDYYAGKLGAKGRVFRWDRSAGGKNAGRSLAARIAKAKRFAVIESGYIMPRPRYFIAGRSYRAERRTCCMSDFSPYSFLKDIAPGSSEINIYILANDYRKGEKTET